MIIFIIVTWALGSAVLIALPLFYEDVWQDIVEQDDEHLWFYILVPFWPAILILCIIRLLVKKYTKYFCNKHKPDGESENEHI